MIERPSIHAYKIHKRIRFISIVFTILVLIYACSTLLYHFFTLKEIQVVGSGISLIVDPQKLPKNLLFLSTSNLVQDIGNRYPQLTNIHVQKHWPNTLVVSMEVRSSFVILQSKGVQYALASDGTIIGMTSSYADQPLFFFDIVVPQEGTKLHDEGIVNGLRLVDYLKHTLPVKQITGVDAETLQVQIDETSILISRNADVKAKADTLQTLFMGFRMKGIIPSVIDLRFTKPIITK